MNAKFDCATPGCRTRSDRPGKCARCHKRARRESNRRRPTSAQRGYGTEHRRAREAVLARDIVCVLCHEPSEVADHYPLTRKQLVELGLDPNDPARMRGLCIRCHNKHTAETSPGGWNR